MTSMRQLLRTAALTLAWLLVLPCLAILLSAMVPIVPWLRLYAIDVVPNRAPWLFLWSLFALAIAMMLHARQRTRSSCALIATAAIATLAGGGVVSRFLYVAGSNGARVNLVKTLSTREYSENAVPDESLVYAEPAGEKLWLDIYRPPTAARTHKGPILVAVHGGGFVAGSRRMGAAFMRAYARRGWTVVALDYRLATPHRPTWNLAIRDVRCGLAWVAAHAEMLGVDINRLSLTGGSAGGHLAMAAAYAPDDSRFDPRCGSRIPRIAALVIKAPLIDPRGSWQQAGELRDLQRDYMRQYLGGTPEKFPDRYRLTDLRRYADRRNPPTLILAGSDDPLLPAASVEDFARRSAAAGNTIRLVMFPYSGHDFNTSYHSIGSQATMQIVAQFLLDSHAVAARR